jgi:hypothetical protein
MRKIMMRKIIVTSLIKLLLVAGILMTANSAYSWGSLGHQVVCDIAWRASSPSVQRALSAASKRMGYKTFADSCTWADKIKSQSRYDDLKPLHYMNLSRHQQSASSADCLHARSPQCVLTAIEHYSHIMSRASVSQKERDKALLLVGHFVADIHQPLHVSYKDDRGGTRKKVNFKGKPTNLHRLWDTQLLYCQKIEGRHPTWRRLGKSLFSGAKNSDDELEPEMTQSAINRNDLTLTVSLWAQESFDITRQIYAELGRSSKTIYLSDDYCARYYSVAISRLQQAGKRLSVLLQQNP